jgi:hypothetical protein
MDSGRGSTYSVTKEVAMLFRARMLVPVAAWILASVPLAAQTSRPAVGDLAALLDRGRLDSVAARVPGSADAFVAAFYVPGQQLILVSGRYAAPALLREKILAKRYREAYQDLYGASDPATRSVIEDLRADGLRAERVKNGPFDVYTSAGAAPVFFDGDWKRHKLSEDAYRDAFERADASYARMIGVLVAALTEPGGAAQPAAQTGRAIP